MLATLIVPTGGEATVAGADLRRQPELVRQRIGYVAQSGGTDPAVTGREELVLQGRLYGLDAKTAKARAPRSCSRRSSSRRPPTARRRPIPAACGAASTSRSAWSIARGSCSWTSPRPASIRRRGRTCGTRSGDFATDGTTVFMTTHYLDEADALCDRLAIIDHGRIVAEGTPDALKRAVAGDVVTLGVDGSSDLVRQLVERQPYVREAVAEEGTVRLYVDRGETALPALLRLLDGAGLAPKTIALARPSLDDVFLRQTGRSLRDEAA